MPNNKKNRVLAIYARQSRDNGKEGSINDQLTRGRAKAMELGIPFLEYVDRGKSAASDDLTLRPEFQKLLDDIQSKIVSEVFVIDNSRLTRNEAINYFMKKIFKEYNVIVYSHIDGQIDFNDLEATMISDIKAIFNTKYARDTSKKIKMVLETNALKGRAHVGVLKPFGYTQDAQRMLVIDDREALVVKKIYSLCLSGYGSGAIAKMLNERKIPTKTNRLLEDKKIGLTEKSMFHQSKVTRFKQWAPNVVLNILKNPIYKGIRIYKGKEIPAPAIVEIYTWENAQSNILKNTNASGLHKNNYLLKNLCRCKRCNSRFCGKSRKKNTNSNRDHFYYCASKINSTPNCGIRSINIDFLDALVWGLVVESEMIFNRAKDEVQKVKNPKYLNELDDAKNKLTNDIIARKRGAQKLASLILQGAFNDDKDIEKQISKHEQELKKSEKQLSEINRKLDDQNAIINSIDYAESFIKHYKELAFSGDFYAKYNLIRLFVDYITIDYNDITEIYEIEIFVKVPFPQSLYTFKVKNLELIEEFDEHSNNGSNNNSSDGNTFNSNVKLKSGDSGVHFNGFGTHPLVPQGEFRNGVVWRPIRTDRHQCICSRKFSCYGMYFRGF